MGFSPSLVSLKKELQEFSYGAKIQFTLTLRIIAIQIPWGFSSSSFSSFFNYIVLVLV